MKRFSSVLLALIMIIAAHSLAPAQEEARALWQVTRYDLTANVGSAERALNVRAVLSAVNIGQGAGRTLTLRLSPQAEVKTASVGDATTTFRSSPEAKTNIQQVRINLPGGINPGGSVTVALDYRLSPAENSALIAISPLNSQFLPLSFWYPTPNTQFALRGADTAPFRLTVNTGGEAMAISAGKSSGAAGGTLTFDQPLYAQPFFLIGKWDAVEGAGEARGTSALISSGATAEERRGAESAIAVAAAARAFFAATLGAAPEVPIKLVTVDRGAGFNEAGVVLVSPAAFRRQKLDSVTALTIAETVARLWIGGSTPLRGEGTSVLREGLVRFLATTFIEKQFGSEAAESERTRERIAYAAIAKRDGPLAQSTPFFDTHFNATANKGAMVWRLVDRMLGREAFLSLLKSQLEAKRADGLTLADFRRVLVERGGANLQAALDYSLDQPTEMDLLIGIPRQEGGESIVALRNAGPLALSNVVVAATVAAGQVMRTEVNVPARDFGEARFKTGATPTRVEIDPDKLYPQIDYTNDYAPRPITPEDPLAEATKFFARQEYAKAEEKAREVLRFAPQTQEARILLGRTLLGAGKLEESAKVFRALLAEPLPLATAMAWANLGLGEIALRQGQAGEAAKFFEQAVIADAEYGATLAARAGRIKAEASAAPAIDESVKNVMTQLDAAIRSGRKADLDAQIVSGELTTFAKGIVGNQPEVWQTKVLRTERLGADRIAADVFISTKVLGKEESGTAVLVFDKVNNSWKLSGVELFEVR